MAEAHNNVKAGLFMAVGIILTLAVIVVLADPKRLMTPKQTVAVRFALADGLQGLKDGAQVTIGNVPAGAVTAIEHHEESGVVVAAVVNFPPKQIGRMISEVLVLGFPDEQDRVVLIRPDLEVPNGARLF